MDQKFFLLGQPVLLLLYIEESDLRSVVLKCCLYRYWVFGFLIESTDPFVYDYTRSTLLKPLDFCSLFFYQVRRVSPLCSSSSFFFF